MMLAARLFNSLPWWQLIPRFANNNWGRFQDVNNVRLSTKNNNIYVAYFFGNNTKTGTIKKMNNKLSYTAKWYDPRTGIYKMIGSEIQSTTGQWTIPTRPDSHDWILLLTSNKNPS
jgi:hypothetical protein